MTRPSSYHLPNGVLYEVDDEQGHVVSIFPDGVVCPGVAQFEDADYERAVGLGYDGTRPEVCWAMHRDHDLLHHIVARAAGWPYSLVLWLAGQGLEGPPGLGLGEERMVFLLTRALNRGGVLPDALVAT